MTSHGKVVIASTLQKEKFWSNFRFIKFSVWTLEIWNLVKMVLKIEWFMPTRWYIIILVLVYITSLIPYLNPNIKSFTIEKLVYLGEIILEWMGTSWGCTDTSGWGKFFKPLYCLLNSSVLLLLKHSPRQLGTFMVLIHGKGAMYFSIFFFLSAKNIPVAVNSNWYVFCRSQYIQQWTSWNFGTIS